jgi:HlyD family secretion protein
MTAIAVATFAVAWALRPSPMVVETITAVRGPLTASVIAEGRTRVKSVYVVAAPVSGELERIAVEPGAVVAPGATVARIWPIAPTPLDARSRAEAEAAVTAARATVARAEAVEQEAAGALTHAASQLATARTLSSAGAVPPKDAEHAGHEMEIRREALGAARAALQAARAELQRAQALVATGQGPSARPATLVPSPVAGRVLRLLRESAGPVIAGTPLIEIGNTADVEVVADLLTAGAMEVQAGAAATLRDWGGPGAIAARVRRVDPAAFTKVSALGVEEQRVPVVLDVLGPPRGLGHDFRVTVSIAVWQGQQVLTVPATALFRAGDRWAVFTVRDGRMQTTLVSPGRSDGTRTAIDRGLADGQEVVIQPSDRLRDGMRVAVTRVAPVASP